MRSVPSTPTDTPNIARIRKLLNVTEAAGAARNEAAVARHLAERLLAAAGLTEDDVRQDGASPLDPARAAATAAASVAIEYGVVMTASWQRIAMVAVGYVTGCCAYTQATRLGPRKILRRSVWIGTAAQREAAHVLYAWLLAQINRLARSAGKTLAVDQRRRFLHGYRLGIADQIASDAKQLAAARTQAVHDTSALLRQDAIDQAITRLIPEGVKLTRAPRASAIGMAAGRLDGATIALQPRVRATDPDRVRDPARLLSK